jgi:hypothetical protein
VGCVEHKELQVAEQGVQSGAAEHEGPQGPGRLQITERGRLACG